MSVEVCEATRRDGWRGVAATSQQCAPSTTFLGQPRLIMLTFCRLVADSSTSPSSTTPLATQRTRVARERSPPERLRTAAMQQAPCPRRMLCIAAGGCTRRLYLPPKHERECNADDAVPSQGAAHWQAARSGTGARGARARALLSHSRLVGRRARRQRNGRYNAVRRLR